MIWISKWSDDKNQDKGPRPKAIASETKDIKALSERQQTVSKDLEKANLETDALRARLNQLTEDQKAMDAEIEQLDTLLKQ